MEMRIDFTDLPEFRADMLQAPRVLGEEVRTAMRATALQGETLSKLYIPPRIDTGAARGSIYSRVVGMFTAIWGATAEHAFWIEKGRRAGAKMPPKGALVGWRGVTEATEFVVRRAIARRGIPPHPFVGKAFDEISTGFVQQQLSAALARTLRRIGGG